MVVINQSVEKLFAQAQEMDIKGDFTSSIDIYKHLDQVCPGNISIKKSLANSLLNAGNHSDAFIFYEQCLGLDQKQADIYLNMGAIYKIQSHIDFAIESFTKAINLNPNYSMAYSNLGNCLYEKKIFDKALECFQSVSRLEPDNHGALFSACCCSQQLGLIDLAIDYCSQAIKIYPYHFEYHNQIMQLVFFKNKMEEAASLCDVALSIFPSEERAYFNKGNILMGMKKYREAIAYYDQALALKSSFIEVYNNKALSLLDLGMFEEAIETCQIGLKQDSSFDKLYFILSKCLEKINDDQRSIDLFHSFLASGLDSYAIFFELGKLYGKINAIQSALTYYDLCIQKNDNFAEAYINKGYSLYSLGQYEKGVAILSKGIKILPKEPLGYANLSLCYFELRQFDLAIEMGKKAIEFSSNNETFYSNLAVFMQTIGCFEDAIAYYKKALEINPISTVTITNMGTCYDVIRQVNDGLSCFNRAIELDPTYVSAHFNKSLNLISQGNYEEGLPLYKYRFEQPPTKDCLRQYPFPLLDTDQVQGKKILMYPEQGLGDSIHFCRFAKVLADKGAQVYLEVHESLKTLLEDLDTRVNVRLKDDVPSFFDYHTPYLTTASILNITPRSIPFSSGYIKSPKEYHDRWKKILGNKERLRVGFNYFGSKIYKNDRRSVPLIKFARLFDLPFEFHCLQNSIPEDEKEQLLSHSNVSIYTEDLVDFAQTAALIDHMDVVVTMDTAVAHLTGALGKRGLLMLTYNPHCFWHLEGETSPWYDSLLLYRQTQNRCWDEVLTNIQDALKKQQT